MLRTLMASACAVAALLFCAASCRRPVSDETFIRADGSGRYEFVMDMADSLCIYDLSFYTRVESDVDVVPMIVTWYSPEGKVFTEKIQFPVAQSPVAPYRQDCDPSPRGSWRLMVKADAPGMRGLGLVLRRKPLPGN